MTRTKVGMKASIFTVGLMLSARNTLGDRKAVDPDFALRLIESSVRSLPRSSREHRRRTQVSSCTLSDLVGGDCTFDEYCSDEGVAYVTDCTGDPAGDWTLRETYPERCYESLDDFNGFLRTDEHIELSQGGTCSVVEVTFRLSGALATSVSFVETVTEPPLWAGEYGGEFLVEPCIFETNPEWILEVGYCEVGCPLNYRVGGRECEGVQDCTFCTGENTGTINCASVDPSIVETCSVEGDDDIFVSAYEYFNATGSDAPSHTPSSVPFEAPLPSDEPSEVPSTVPSNSLSISPSEAPLATTLAPTKAAPTEPFAMPAELPVIAPVRLDPVADLPTTSETLGPTEARNQDTPLTRETSGSYFESSVVVSLISSLATVIF